MNMNRYKYFRWTPRTAWINFVYVIAVPAALGYVAYKTDVSHNSNTGILRRYPMGRRQRKRIANGTGS